MLRRTKKEQGSHDTAGPDEPPTGAPDSGRPGDAAIALAEQPVAPTPPLLPDPASSGEPAASSFGPPPAPPPDGDFVERLPASFYFEGVIKPEKVPSRDELERQAEADFRAAIAPSLEALRELVPDASSPDEAMQVLAERQGEALVDEAGANLSSRDIYRNETSVYYRIRTHFDKPSRRPGFGRDWRPPPGLAPPQRGLPSGRRSSR